MMDLANVEFHRQGYGALADLHEKIRAHPMLSALRGQRPDRILFAAAKRNPALISPH
jgi:hypothetical protein